jgi:hypothetical protein
MIDFVLLKLVQREVVDIERKRIDFEFRPQFKVVGVKLNSFLQFVYNKVHKFAHYERTPLSRHQIQHVFEHVDRNQMPCVNDSLFIVFI